ncbi:hypothetical protein KEJ27_01000 [Candidatus Bathyarchaeota archaeon]|nr:hypothetical protein [Candidatus Bathyarchaeota archaeon]MBS7618640.1 hypothetical protein [Candidatus Bathyarchaeota archaeon]
MQYVLGFMVFYCPLPMSEYVAVWVFLFFPPYYVVWALNVWSTRKSLKRSFKRVSILKCTLTERRRICLLRRR